MSGVLHLFNPENDLALASGCRHYTPPPNAASLHRAGALLPMWWAEEDDFIAALPYMEDEAETLRRDFGLSGRIAYGGDVTSGAPWGWSHDASRQLSAFGLKGMFLPTTENIDMIRMLSHRRSSIRILNALGITRHIPLETTDPDRVVRLENDAPGHFIKSPWSCSGRGVFNASTLDKATLYARVAGIIRRQGSVMVEDGLAKILDFAALFRCDSNKVEFKGWSIFRTEARGTYTGNVVAPQSWMEYEIGSRYPISRLHNVTGRLESILADMLTPYYNGWAGVDMMLHHEGKSICLHPCVELNLRTTMGVVAMHIAKRLDMASPHMLGWQLGSDAPYHAGTMTLLPPRDGFRLSLAPLAW